MTDDEISTIVRHQYRDFMALAAPRLVLRESGDGEAESVAVELNAGVRSTLSFWQWGAHLA
jgi:hypothetical protein